MKMAATPPLDAFTTKDMKGTQRSAKESNA